MKKILDVSPKNKPIDKSYFDNYGGDGNYSEAYKMFTVAPETVVAELADAGVMFDTLLDVGCASGELVQDFRRLGITAYGIENSKEVLGRSVVPEYCCEMDMRDIGDIKDSTFDVLYINSLMYLYPQEVLPVLKEFFRIAKMGVYLCVPFLSETEFSDPYRTFLATKSWWKNQFEDCGFKAMKNSDNIYKK